MNLFSAFVVYMLVWWVTLFAVLPLGIRGQAEEGDVVEGSEPGAPVDANIKGKFWLTTKVATVVWAIICALIISGVIKWEIFGEFFNRR